MVNLFYLKVGIGIKGSGIVKEIGFLELEIKFQNLKMPELELEL